MLSCWKSSATAIFNNSKSLLNGTPNLFTQQSRTTVILKRKYPIRLYKKDGKPHKLKHRDFIYDVVEYTEHKPQAPLDIILTQYVEGVGEVGDKLSMKPRKAYEEFLLPGLAVYASPENIEKYLNTTTIVEKTSSSKYAPLMQKMLSECCLQLHMSIETPWILEKWHIRANFRKMQIAVPDYAITMPDNEIKGPNLENEGKEFYITVTINKTESAKVRCQIRHSSADVAKQLVFEDPQYWMKPGKALFPEDQEILDSLPLPKWSQPKKSKNN